ncbi:MAG TPA: hypothetical protein VE591_08815 [Candidatus Acidoferrum sp.]|nr:hypothetical protein [Candidatus Acidoferrum sp.]
MVGATAVVRGVNRAFKMRVRQWGRLPAARGATLLIANHQHEDEGEVIVERTFLQGPRRPVVTANSRRMFETGFFATRLPWTARFTRTFNPSGLFALLGFMPIENQLSSRPLISLAEDLRSAHGDLPLEKFLPLVTLEQLGLAGRSVAELWSPAFFIAAQSPVKLSHVLEPYRGELIAQLRERTARDIAAMVERVRGGATFYITPEGLCTVDGRMRPIRNGLLEALLPIAQPWLCAIAYDPFRGRRLSMLYRVVPPALPRDLVTSLAAARPITTSAILSAFLLERPQPFTRRDAIAGVRERLAALPETAFVDPELRRASDTVTIEALENLVRRTTLARDEGRYRLTAVRGDRRFPDVADIVSFEHAMLEETVAAARRITYEGEAWPR